MKSKLLELGFDKINKEYELTKDDNTLAYYDYSFYLADGRRGQQYYILIDKEKRVLIYATKPDGSGCPGEVSIKSIEILMQLKELGYGK